ncbi:MAG: aminotransferase class III-fold pyridoxal phosphate-dependent enzyme [Candidatus Aenigmarchaeota archaeon]|nr:aminotransferase class III-fold pyridoxal phosphate-dependent enzyme [Candidatus Aenigmarchaeota archaeon]
MTKFICRRPGPKSVAIIRRDDKISSPSLTREYSFVYKKAKGMNIWDVDGRKYLDFSASVAVMGVGHTDTSVAKAITKQAKIGFHCGFSDFYAEVPVQFCETILKHAKGFDRIFLSNSGTESVEAAYKLARWHSKKKWTIAFKPSFHGRTMGSLSLTNSRPIHRDRFSPFMPTTHVPYPYLYRSPYHGNENEQAMRYLDNVENAMKRDKGDVASIFFEPICGEGGYIVPPKAFVRGLRKLCNQYGVLLCADEVQSGCYRTGKFMAMENFGVRADIVSMSKAIGGGIPLGATLSSNKVMNWPSGAHANTFGGNLIACAAGIATLGQMKNKKLGANAAKIGKMMLKRLHEMKQTHDLIGDVRGIGLMIGIEIVNGKANDEVKSSQILCKAAEKGLLLLPAGKSSIRICPPLIINKQQAEHGLDILDEAIGECYKQ